MSNNDRADLQKHLEELSSRRLYENTANYFNDHSALVAWDKLTTNEQDLFKRFASVTVYDIPAGADIPPPLPSEQPKNLFLTAPMVVWETGILIVCSIIISYLIR